MLLGTSVAAGTCITLPYAMHASLQEDGQEEDDTLWNLSVAGGTCLGLAARVVGNEIVPMVRLPYSPLHPFPPCTPFTPAPLSISCANAPLLPSLPYRCAPRAHFSILVPLQVMPFIQANISKNTAPEDWRLREAATFAFGLILDGPDPACFADTIKLALGFLLQAIKVRGGKAFRAKVQVGGSPGHYGMARCSRTGCCYRRLDSSSRGYGTQFNPLHTLSCPLPAHTLPHSFLPTLGRILWCFSPTATLVFTHCLIHFRPLPHSFLPTASLVLIHCPLPQDPHSHVKDTTAWTLGRIFEFLHDHTIEPPIITRDTLPPIVSVLLVSLKDRPHIAYRWATHGTEDIGGLVYITQKQGHTWVAKEGS